MEPAYSAIIATAGSIKTFARCSETESFSDSNPLRCGRHCRARRGSFAFQDRAAYRRSWQTETGQAGYDTSWAGVGRTFRDRKSVAMEAAIYCKHPIKVAPKFHTVYGPRHNRYHGLLGAKVT
jgi:hypothetical protein